MRRSRSQSARISGGPGSVAPQRKSEDDFVLSSPVSEQRKAAFLEEFLTQRRNAQVVEMLFDRAGAFRLEPSDSPKNVESVGFKGIIFKGPFVERSNWLQGSGWDFAVPLERRLLQRLDEAFRTATAGRFEGEINRDARALTAAFDDMTRELASMSFRPTLLALGGDIGTHLYMELTKEVIPDWDSRVTAALRTTYRIIGMYHDLPILEIPEAQESAVYAVDLARFATLTRYGEQPVFEVEEFTE